jgi:hypothetical protein
MMDYQYRQGTAHHHVHSGTASSTLDRSGEGGDAGRRRETAGEHLRA